jgi:hypothetical protein
MNVKNWVPVSGSFGLPDKGIRETSAPIEG